MNKEHLKQSAKEVGQAVTNAAVLGVVIGTIAFSFRLIRNACAE